MYLYAYISSSGCHDRSECISHFSKNELAHCNFWISFYLNSDSRNNRIGMSWNLSCNLQSGLWRSYDKWKIG